jgi:hypothetical protein
MPGDAMKAPDFFILGAPKCGTTSLAVYLREHPRAFMCEPKEPDFFDSDAPKRSPCTLESYLGLFRDADPSRHLAVGEASTGYLFSRAAVPAILEFEPKARFIVMLRDPVEMAQALHSEQVYSGYEDLRDFEAACRAEPDRKAGRRVPRGCPNPQKLLYSEWCRLGEQVERLLSRVDPSRVHFILFEDFAARTRESYEAALGFLDLPGDGRASFPRVRSNRKVRFLHLHRASQHFSYTVAHWKTRLGFKGGSGVLEKLRSFTAPTAPRPQVKPELLRALRELFRPDVQKLSRLLGRDLSSWESK